MYLSPIVNRAQSMKSGPEYLPSDRILTPATGLTIARPILGAWAAERLYHGKKGVSPIVAVMAATDMEGRLARFISKHWPESGLGVSTAGADLDPLADTAAILEVAAAALVAPRVSTLGKMAVATMFGQEGFKTKWALGANKIYKAQTNGERLTMPVSNEGKEAMAKNLLVSHLQ